MDQYTEIIQQFQLLGFSDNEARVYIDLLKRPNQNGSQIAKELDITRPSAYLALDKLYRKGAIYLVSGDSKDYVAKDPKTLFSELKEKISEAADQLMDDLTLLSPEKKQDFYFNIEGKENILQKARFLISEATKELYIDTNYKLSIFQDELTEAIDRGVRVIAFSFHDIMDVDLPIESYHKESPLIPSDSPGEESITLVKDYETALIAGSRHDENFVGTFSSNYLFVKMISQHIHFDIYLTQFEQKFNLNWSEVHYLNTLREKLG